MPHCMLSPIFHCTVRGRGVWALAQKLAVYLVPTLTGAMDMVATRKCQLVPPPLTLTRRLLSPSMASVSSNAIVVPFAEASFQVAHCVQAGSFRMTSSSSKLGLCTRFTTSAWAARGTMTRLNAASTHKTAFLHIPVLLQRIVCRRLCCV